METRVSSATKEVLITAAGPTVLIGERINPSGKKKLAAALKRGDIDAISREAVAQVAAGADILDINVACSGVDEIAMLPKVVEKVMAAVDVPLCIDINNPAALKETLKIYHGKPIVNSVTGEERSLNEILPLVKEYGAAVIGLTIDDEGISQEPDRRVAIAHKIVERAAQLKIPPEDVIIDCLALSLGADSNVGLVTLEAVRKVKAELGVNQTLGASNISFGLPDRHLVNHTFLALAIAAGVTCPTVDAAKVGAGVLSIDLVLGRDRFAQRYTRDFRQRKRQKDQKN
ncbi:5-methyltetrahydrofolate--homocysteine methyltransferase (EC [Olavius sp. associated proteobacterium Delta 1]|nr:5-methyltetrahydrofolate--homocysteine methyltransferase (EC [Olavius sp. associated proteobacterium Delta 1]